jgi:hypothetical protein
VVIYKKIPNLLILEIEERQSIGIWCQVQRAVIGHQPSADSQSLAEGDEVEDEMATTTVTDRENLPSGELLSDQEVSPEKKIEKCFYIDKEGIIYKESPLISGSLVLNIYGTQDKLADIRTKVTSSEIIDFILTIRKELPQIKTADGPLPTAVDFEIVSPEDLRVTTAEGWQIYFNPTYSVDFQIKALAMVFEQEIKENRRSLEYVDLRIEGRVYYK